MDSILTLIGSIVIGSIFLLNVFSFYGGITSHSQEKYLELRTQETAVSMMEIIEHDFRRMGTGVETPSQSITATTDTTDITFIGNIDDDGATEIVRYYKSNKSAAVSTENPDDVILYRVVDNTPDVFTPAGVTGFSFRMYDNANTITNNRNNASSIEVRLEMQSMISYSKDDLEKKYAEVILKKFITPEALIRVSGLSYP